MNQNRTGFCKRLGAPWGVSGVSEQRNSPARILRGVCRAAIARIFGARVAVNGPSAEISTNDLNDKVRTLAVADTRFNKSGNTDGPGVWVSDLVNENGSWKAVIQASDGKYYEISLAMDGEKVTFSGDATEVVRKTEYESAQNAAAGADDIAFGTAVNVAPIDQADDDWINISPYGEFPNELGTQVVDREAAESMVAVNNSFLGKLGNLFRGIPIYRGHPHQHPEIWPDDVRYGRVNALEARDDGLYGKVAWNDLGQKNKEQGYYVYPSPGWRYRRLSDGRIKPMFLDHIGLTNKPNIFEAVPVTNSRTGAGRTSGSAEHQQNKSKGDKVDRTQLIAALGLEANATDDQILTAINTLKDEKKNPLVVAVNTQLATANTEKQTAVNDAKRFRELAINAQLDRFTDKGVITAADRDEWKGKFETNFETALADIAKKQPAINTQGLKLSPNGKDLSDSAKRRMQFNARIDELTLPTDRGGKGLSLDAAINTMRGNAEDAALLKAMDTELVATN